MVEFRLLGGALARQAAIPNAVTGRHARYSNFTVGVLAGSATPTQVGGLWNEIDRARLLTAKARLDPNGLFRPSQIIG